MQHLPASYFIEDVYKRQHQISAVDMHVENLDSDKMICYPVIQGERINYQNK